MERGYKKKLSKTLSYILRHHPEKFDVELNEQGFTDLDLLIDKLREKFPSVNKEDVYQVVYNFQKKRFQIENNKIRALYGHSIKIDLDIQPIVPPKFLYHGTTFDAYKKIKKSGLKSIGREFVHLSEDKRDARLVGKRRTTVPVILQIEAMKAHKDKIKFMKTGDMYLTKEIPFRYINREQ